MLRNFPSRRLRHALRVRRKRRLHPWLYQDTGWPWRTPPEVRRWRFFIVEEGASLEGCIVAECPDYPTALDLASKRADTHVYSETQMLGHARLLLLLVTWDRGEAPPESSRRDRVIIVPPSEDEARADPSPTHGQQHDQSSAGTMAPHRR